MSLVFACPSGGISSLSTPGGPSRLEGPVPSDGMLKGHLYAWTVRLGFVAVRRFGECVRSTGPCARNPACCAGSVIDE
ncbi:MAG TPA: hypothetical protein VN372_13200 [Methanospirillum sp.]|nr:hypothetical protein [Methanospirillum sp.]